MIINCPKCGFTQPKDRYCASCGLDIEKFKPVPDSITQKIGKNTRLQIIVTIVLVLGLGLFIYQSQKQTIQNHLQKIPNILSAELSPADGGASQLSNNIQPADSTKADELATAPNNAETATTHADTSIPHKKPEQIQFTFAEMSITAVDQIAQEGQQLNSSGAYRAFTLADNENLSTLKKRDNEFQTIGSSESFMIQTSERQSLNYLKAHPTIVENVGLEIEVQSELAENGQIEINLWGSLKLKAEDNSDITSQQITGNFLISPSSILVLSGLLPHAQIRRSDISLFSNTPLEIYASAQFINAITEFVIFVEPQ